MNNWSVTKDKNKYWHVRPSKNGRFRNKKEAIKNGQRRAMDDKTFLRVHDEGKGYETFDFTNILSPEEWIGKTLSDYKISKAEYMIARTRRNEARNDLYWARIFRKNEDSFTKLKVSLNNTQRRLRRYNMALREAKRRYKEAKKSSK